MNAVEKGLLWERIYQTLQWYGGHPERLDMANNIVYNFRTDLWVINSLDDEDLTDWLLDYDK